MADQRPLLKRPAFVYPFVIVFAVLNGFLIDGGIGGAIFMAIVASLIVGVGYFVSSRNSSGS